MAKGIQARNFLRKDLYNREKHLKAMVRIALVGAGYWGPNFLRIASQMEGAEISWCCDLDEARLKEIKALYPDIKITKDYRELLKDRELKGVIIATPAVTHYPIARDFIEKGINVLQAQSFTTKARRALSEARNLFEEKKYESSEQKSQEALDYARDSQQKKYYEEKDFTSFKCGAYEDDSSIDPSNSLEQERFSAGERICDAIDYYKDLQKRIDTKSADGKTTEREDYLSEGKDLLEDAIDEFTSQDFDQSQEKAKESKTTFQKGLQL